MPTKKPAPKKVAAPAKKVAPKSAPKKAAAPAKKVASKPAPKKAAPAAKKFRRSMGEVLSVMVMGSLEEGRGNGIGECRRNARGKRERAVHVFGHMVDLARARTTER